MGRWRVPIQEYAASLNGGVEVEVFELRDMGITVNKKRKVFSDRGRLIYQLESGKMAQLQPGDVIHLANGDVVELT